jgi:hypothetical protein
MRKFARVVLEAAVMAMLAGLLTAPWPRCV